MKFSNQLLLAFAAVFFMMKGGFGIIAAAWKFVLPLIFIGTAYYLIKKAFSPAANLPKGAGYDSPRMKTPDPVSAHENSNANAVIEICPHCLSEVGSCPKCKKKRFF